MSSIGRLIGVYASSIVNWGYQDNFKPVYFFFLRTNLDHTKSTKTQNKRFPPSQKFLCTKKTIAFVVFCSLIFILLVGFCLICVFVRLRFFRKKKKIINRVSIVLIISVHYISFAYSFRLNIFTHKISDLLLPLGTEGAWDRESCLPNDITNKYIYNALLIVYLSILLFFHFLVLQKS